MPPSPPIGSEQAFPAPTCGDVSTPGVTWIGTSTLTAKQVYCGNCGAMGGGCMALLVTNRLEDDVDNTGIHPSYQDVDVPGEGVNIPVQLVTNAVDTPFTNLTFMKAGNPLTWFHPEDTPAWAVVFPTFSSFNEKMAAQEHGIVPGKSWVDFGWHREVYGYYTCGSTRRRPDTSRPAATHPRQGLTVPRP